MNAKFSSALALAILGSTGLSAVVAVPPSAQTVPSASASQPTPVKISPAPQEDRQRRTNAVKRMVSGDGNTRRRRSGPGWTNKHAQRVARKARNVRRSRQASR